MFLSTYSFTNWISTESYFLFGPRQTGKTTALADSFPSAIFADLLSRSARKIARRRFETLSNWEASTMTFPPTQFSI